MILTEEKARTKRCQESFGDTNVSPAGTAYSAHIQYGCSTAVQTSPSYCIGSACMAWRWVRSTVNDMEGYCGKAGQP
jgi:hypothetical protein